MSTTTPTLLSTIQILLLRSTGARIDQYPSPLPAEPHTHSSYISLSASEKFLTKIHIPFSAPFHPKCSVVKIRLFIEGTKVQESNVERTQGENVNKIFREAEISKVAVESQGEEEDEEEREIVIQISQCWRGDGEEILLLPGGVEERLLAFTFHPRTPSELQLHPSLSLLLAETWRASNIPLPASTTTYLTPFSLQTAESSYKNGELYCRCRRIRLPLGWENVERGLVGAVTCDREGCKVGTWHKWCVGMREEEEPEWGWVCPECMGEGEGVEERDGDKGEGEGLDVE